MPPFTLRFVGYYKMVIYEGNRFVANCRPALLANYLNQLSPAYKGVINIYEGKAHYKINAVVARYYEDDGEQIPVFHASS